jgi:hypothetical protein
MHQQNLGSLPKSRLINGLVLPFMMTTLDGVYMTDKIIFCIKHKIQLMPVGKKPHFRCRLCANENKRIWSANNKHLIKAQNKRASERMREWIKEDRKKNPEKYKEYARKGWIKNGEIRNTSRISKKYGLTVSEYLVLVEKQDNKCLICKKQETRKSKVPEEFCRLCIDHCHKTGKVRGLLCHNCNQFIGYAKESIEILKQAILYLEKHSHTE